MTKLTVTARMKYIVKPIFYEISRNLKMFSRSRDACQTRFHFHFLKFDHQKTATRQHGTQCPGSHLKLRHHSHHAILTTVG